jgi:uncharacterized small protein (DUF1192 family)
MGRLAIAFGLVVALAHSAGADEVKPISDVEARLAALEAELARIRASSDAAMDSDISLETKEPLFRLYGFIDMGLQKLWSSDPAETTPTTTTFVLGNINLYFDFRPAQDWKSLIEVRLTNYPQGTIDTTVHDPANGAGDDSVKWSAIILERAYMEWHKLDYLNIRVGQFLTPYGIWNVDHGTPTLISLHRPEFITEELWPTYQLGIEALGRLDHFGAWMLQYNAYISNGRTNGVLDLTNDKTLGGRLALSTSRPHSMTFGLSAMHGTFVDATTPTMPIAKDEYGVAADASIDLGAARLRSELTTRRLRANPGTLAWQEDFYMLAAYRLPTTKLEPYVYFEGVHDPVAQQDLEAIASAGLNLYFTPAIQLKLQYSHTEHLKLHDVDSTSPHIVEDLLDVKLVMGL